MRALPPWITLAGLTLAAPAPAGAHHREAPGSLVGISVEVEGHPAPLYPAPEGSGRYYLEAREGRRYAVHLVNRTRERLGVVLVVDGLNAVSGERSPDLSREPWARPGRMYVLDPWDATTVRGWRTSLREVRRFTFVDERVSYSARSGKANAKMGWIEVVVFREHRPYVRRWLEGVEEWFERDAPARSREEAARPPATVPPRGDAPVAESPSAGAMAPRSEAGKSAEADREARERLRAHGYSGGDEGGRSYPGTGWGPRASDPVTVVEFEPERRPAEIVALRYEYAGALRALGILPRPWPDRDRLWEREHGRDGFAAPPAW